ncbi:MAG: hypothetical protein ABR875_03120 [Minisyncoccia bacterium]
MDQPNPMQEQNNPMQNQNPSMSVPPMPPVEPKKGLKKFLPSLLIIVILAAIYVCFAAFFGWWPMSRNQVSSIKNQGNPTLSPTQDLTTNWKTYSNSTYGFELKYPSDWNDLKIDDENLDLNVTPGGDDSLTLYLKTSDKNYENNWKYTDNFGYAPMFTIDINTPVSWKNNWENPNRPATGKPTILTQNDKFIIAYTKSQNCPSDLSVACGKTDQILSTFKFTSQIDTSSWKTYTNSQYGFEFKYPSNYSEVLPAPGGGVNPEGYTSFIAGSKSTTFHLNFTKFSGSVSELVALNKQQKAFSVQFSSPQTITEQKTINNLDITWYDNNQVYFVSNGFGFMLFSDDKNVSMIDQILSTFKFTK